MSDNYSDDDFESSAAVSKPETTKTSSQATSRSASAASSAAETKSSSATSSRSQSASAAALSHEEHDDEKASSHHDASSHSSHKVSEEAAAAADNERAAPSDDEKHSAEAYTESSSASSASSSSSSSRRSSSAAGSHSASAHSSSRATSASQRKAPAPTTAPMSRAAAAPFQANNAEAADDDDDKSPVARGAGSRKGRATGRSHGSPRSARAADAVEVAAVPETQEQLDDMLVQNEDLRERLFEVQRRRYRAGLSSTRQSSKTKKDEAAAAVQESLANERLAQILRAERKDLRQKRDYLEELVKRYKKASKYRDLILQAKDDIDMLNEENRDLQLEVRCNEKLLVANADAKDSGRASHRLQEELRARNALTERGVQHALRDADDAERQRDGVQQRVDKLRDEIEARRSAPTSRHLDQLEAAREDNREKRARVRAMENQVARVRGGGGANGSRPAPRSSMSLRTEAEKEYLRERIAAMRDEIDRIQHGDQNVDDNLSGTPTPTNRAAAGGAGYPSALQDHEKHLSASANASRKASAVVAASPHGQSAAWLDDENQNPSKRPSVSGPGVSSGSAPHSAAASPNAKRGTNAGVDAAPGAAAPTTAEDPFFAAAFGDEALVAGAAAAPQPPAHPAPAAEPVYDMSAPTTAAAEDDWLLDALKEPAANEAHSAAAHNEAPDWLMGETTPAVGDNNAEDDLYTAGPPVHKTEDFVFQEEPVDDIFGDLQFGAAAPAPAPAAPAVRAGGEDVPDWLQF